MKTIIITNKSEINAEGNLHSKKTKSVLCIDTGEVFTSATDTANKEGVHLSAISACCTGKVKTVKGKRYCYLCDAYKHLDAMASQIRSLSELKPKANAWDAQEAEKAAIRKAEEDRIAAERKAEEERLAAIEKKTKMVDKYQNAYEKLHQQMREVALKLRDAQYELSQLTGEVEPDVA